MKKIIFTLLSIIGFPIVLTMLLNLSLFKFAPGKVDSWITFWGSYVGAIVGASVVYFVAQLQMKNQQKMQIEAIKIENKNSTRREMHRFHLTNKLEKIEEMHGLLNKLSAISIELNNDLLIFVITRDAIERELKSKREDFNPKEKIYQLRSDLREYHFEMLSIFMRLIVLSEYVHQGIQDGILHLQEEFLEIYDEVKECYYSKEAYKKYLGESGDELFILESVDSFTRKLSQLSFRDLQKELRDTLHEINEFKK